MADQRNPASPDRRLTDQPVETERRVSSSGRRKADKLACQRCGHLATTVLPHEPTVPEQLSGKYWRRRRCDRCGFIDTTSEYWDQPPSALHTDRHI